MCNSVTERNLGLLDPCSKANLLMPGCGEGECSVYCRAPSKESRWLVLKKPELPEDFWEKVFKDSVRQGVFWGVWSASGQSSDWLGMR